MKPAAAYRSSTPAREPSLDRRLKVLMLLFCFAFFMLVGRLFQLQVLEGASYKLLASDQHEIQSSLIPTRGALLLRDRWNGTLYPFAKDRDVWIAYAVPREMKDEHAVASSVSPLLAIPLPELEAQFASHTTYTVLSRDVPPEAAETLQSKHLQGIGITQQPGRFYPETGLGGHVFGFVSAGEGQERTGKYGVEGFYDARLAGSFGSIQAEKDARGGQLTIGNINLTPAVDGVDLVLTIDRAIQYEACTKIKQAVERFEAVGGSVIIMDPDNGAILAMCSTPDFDPAAFGSIKDVSVLNNPATFYEFEPGSIFKPVTMAAGLDAGKVTPQTTYEDTGEEKIDGFTIRNSDHQGHGIQTMTDVLTKSLNTGTIFVERLLGRDAFRDYVQKFGFGAKTGVDVKSEAAGNVKPLDRAGKVFAATASYGQGITVTPLQMVVAYAALANGGSIVTPHVVQAVRYPDGREEDVTPAKGAQVITERTSRLITGMLVNVVEIGHGKRASVPGYYVAGKTGTAQIARTDGKGYVENASIGSFAGYAPAEDPAFVMLVKIDRPKTVEFAESSAAPVFGDLAAFLLPYLRIKPERPIAQKPVAPLPVLPATTTSP